MQTNLIKRSADNVRALIVAMVEKSKSGHPGGAMGGADFVATLFANHLVYDPTRPDWIARDRFFLDPGHMSPMLYSILALTGRYTMGELAQLRQWGSVTPGHPELEVARGIENTSGPLGQGHVMAVGAAIAERILVDKFGEVAAGHYTYTYISDGGIQEEISQGAGRLAGHLGLNKLIMFYDSNDVQLSTKVDEVTSEDTASKYRAWGWNVLEIDGNDPVQIDAALTLAKSEQHRPTLIIGHTIMAKGALAVDGQTLEGAVSTHGQPLSKAGGDVKATLQALGADPGNPFKIFADVEAAFASRREELTSLCGIRHEAERLWAEANKEAAATFANWSAGKLPSIPWEKIEYKANMASRNSSALVLGMLAEHLDNMVVSSADLANSDKTDGFLKKTRALCAGNFGGRFLQSGVAELTMAAVMNGIALHGGLIAACGTFFVFSDYVKPALRLSALMELPVKYIFTHDAFRVGEDGPTHEPVEHESQIRLLEQMDNLSGEMSTLVLRPADTAETIEAWRLAIENQKTPSVLIFSRQDLPDLKPVGENRRKEAAAIYRGGYVVRQTEGIPDIVLVANGSEVSLLCEAADMLEENGIKARVVSVPSIGLFMRQDQSYLDEVMPGKIARFGLTAGLPAVLYPLMRGCRAPWGVKGLERFGASAPYKVLDEKFGFTVDNVANEIRTFLQHV